MKRPQMVVGCEGNRVEDPWYSQRSGAAGLPTATGAAQQCPAQPSVRLTALGPPCWGAGSHHRVA